MVKVRENLTGRTFGRLTVLEQAEDYVGPDGRHQAQWLCECECENHTLVIVRGSSLKKKTKPTQSCGCLWREKHFAAIKKYNTYNLSGEYGVGWTTNTNKEFYFDLEDYELIKEYCWVENISRGMSTLIAHDRETGRPVRMHNLLGFKWHDHINQNELDNRKENLRPCEHYQNVRNRGLNKRNTSGCIGVYLDKRYQKWYADIGEANKHRHLGCFADKEDAIRARLEAESKYYGEFAPQKHLFEKYGITIDKQCVVDSEIAEQINDWEPLEFVGNSVKEFTEQND